MSTLQIQESRGNTYKETVQDGVTVGRTLSTCRGDLYGYHQALWVILMLKMVLHRFPSHKTLFSVLTEQTLIIVQRLSLSMTRAVCPSDLKTQTKNLIGYLRRRTKCSNMNCFFNIDIQPLTWLCYTIIGWFTYLGCLLPTHCALIHINWPQFGFLSA